MKILYIHQYFRTPEEGGSTRSYHLAKGLVQAGHEVEMITAHQGEYQKVQVDGITVRYLPVPYANEYGFLRRVYAFLKFVRLAKVESRKIENVDLAYVMTTPLTTGLIALSLKRDRNIPFYFEVGDLWPEAPIQMGAIKSNSLKSILYRFEKKCYREAQKVIALSPAIRNYIEKKSPDTKVHVVPNIAHCAYYRPQVSMREWNEDNPFQIGYFGTFGQANGLKSLIEVAKGCETIGAPVHFHLMGSGAEERNLKKLAEGLSKVSFHPFGSKEKVKALLDQMEAVYVSFKAVPVLNTGSPNKLFDGLAAGKLIIINFDGWIKELIENNGCGFYHAPDEPSVFANKLKRYLHDPEELRVAQQKARKVSEQFYDKDLLVQKLLRILNDENSVSIDDKEVYILTA